MPDSPDQNLADLRQRIRAASDAGHIGMLLLLCREYLRHDQRRWIVWHDLGSALWQMARYREALRALRNALALCPEGSRWYVHAEIGRLYKRWGKYRTAARWFQKMIDARPDEATGYIYRGAALARLGDLCEAEEMHRAATSCKEGCIDEAYLNLGLVLRAQERFSEAADAFRAALELTPDYEEARAELPDAELASAAKAAD